MIRFIKVCVQVHGQLAYPFVVMEGNGSFILHHVYYSHDKFCYYFVTMSNFYYFVTNVQCDHCPSKFWVTRQVRTWNEAFGTVKRTCGRYSKFVMVEILIQASVSFSVEDSDKKCVCVCV